MVALVEGVIALLGEGPGNIGPCSEFATLTCMFREPKNFPMPCIPNTLCRCLRMYAPTLAAGPPGGKEGNAVHPSWRETLSHTVAFLMGAPGATAAQHSN
jgi:hypothetical protein